MTTRNEISTVNKEKKKNSGRSCDFPQALVVVVVVCKLNKEKNILKTPQFLLFSLMMMMMQTPSSLTKNPNPLQQQTKGKKMQRKQAVKCSAAIFSSSDSTRDTATLSLSQLMMMQSINCSRNEDGILMPHERERASTRVWKKHVDCDLPLFFHQSR
jgi:hypothetical protein